MAMISDQSVPFQVWILNVHFHLNLGSFNPIVLSDSDDDFAGFKKKGNKIVFSESDDDDGFSQSAPKPSSSGIYLMFSLIFVFLLLKIITFYKCVDFAFFGTNLFL